MSIQSLIIICGVSLVAVLVGLRARERGIAPASTAQQLVPALLIGGPIIHYVLILSQVTAPSQDLLHTHPGLHMGLVAVPLVSLSLARQLKMRLLLWADICVPPLLLGFAFTSLSFAIERGLPAGLLLIAFWQLGIFWALLQTERLLRARLRPGDTLLLGGVLAVPAAVGSMLMHAPLLCAPAQLLACEGLIAEMPRFVIGVGVACMLLLALRHAWPTTREALAKQ